MKFYAKNNAIFSNHQVLLLIKMIFYVLKKKMIAKCNGGGKLTLQGLHEIYSLMTNVFVSWQAVLMTQMTAQEQEFFSMLFRMRSYKITRAQSFVEKPNINKLIFKPKPEFIITKKINLQYKTYNFFKQLLRMTINSITIMLPSLQISNIKRLVSTIKKSQKIMQQFQQHLFPVEKIQFYLLKCRIQEHASNQLGFCLNIDFKYEFPTGLFGLIYKNLQKWKQGKVLHYVNLLMRVLFVSVRNELMTMKDIYILGWEIKLLLRIVKKRESFVLVQGFMKDQSKKGGRQRLAKQKNSPDNNYSPTKQKQFMTKNNTTKKSSLVLSHQNSATERQLQQKQKQIQNQNISKPTLMTVLKIVLMQIEKFLAQQRELTHIVDCYMKQDYKKYRYFDPNQELVDQIPTLINEIKKKKRYNRQNQQNRKNYAIDQKNEHLQKVNGKNENDLGLNMTKKLSLSKKSSLKQSTSTNKRHQTNYNTQQQNSANSYDNNLLSDKKDKLSYGKRKQADNQKGKEIIMRNIINVKSLKNKGKNKLTLDNRRKNNMSAMETKRTGVTMESQSQLFDHQQNRNSKNSIFRQLLVSTLSSPQLRSISLSSLQEPISLLQQSSSDSQNQLSQQFQTKRRQQISSINNKYYKTTNVNYLINLQSLKNSSKDVNKNDESTTKKFYIDENNNKNQQSQNDINNQNDFFNEGMNKGSQEIEYEQIKMIDEVIKQKVLTLIDVEIDNFYGEGKGKISDINKDVENNDNNSSLQKKKSQNNSSNQPSSNIKLTSKLLKQVQQLNRQQKNLKKILRSKMQTNKIMQDLQQIETKKLLTNKNFNQKSSTEQLIRDLNQVYSITGNSQQKAYKYQQMYRKLLNINDEKNSSLNRQQATKQKRLSSTIKHYANIHKLYNREQHNYENNKLSIIGEAEQQQQQLQKTQRQRLGQQQVKQQQKSPSSSQPKTQKNKHTITINSQLQQQIREKQRQLKFNNNNNSSYNNVSRNKKYVDFNGMKGGNNYQSQKKQIALRQQFDNLRVDVGRSRFNQSNFVNNANKKLIIAGNSNQQLM